MEVDDLHAKEDRRYYAENIPQDPGNLFRQQVADRACQNTGRNGEQNGEQGGNVPEFTNMENQFHVSKAYGKKDRGEKPGKAAVLLFGQPTGKCSAPIGIMFSVIHRLPPRKKSLPL